MIDVDLAGGLLPFRAMDAWTKPISEADDIETIAMLSAVMGHKFAVARRMAAKDGRTPNFSYWRSCFALLHERRDAILAELAAQPHDALGVSEHHNEAQE